MRSRAAATDARHLNRRRWGAVATYSILGLWSLVCLFPVYWVAVTSLKGEYEIVRGPFYLPFIDFTPSLEAWRFVLRDQSDNLVHEYLNSATVGLSSMLLTVFIAALAVYALTRFRIVVSWLALLAVGLVAGLFTAALFAGVPLFSLIFVVAAGLLLLLQRRLRKYRFAISTDTAFVAVWATRILPPVVTVLPIYVMALRTGMLDTRTALVLAYTAANLPIAMWLLRPALGEAATEQEEAALLDGASRLRVVLAILLPMAATGIAATALLVFILSWNEYLIAAYLAAGRAMTLPPWVVGQMSMKEAQVGGDIVEWSRLSAAIMLAMAPIFILAAVAQRLLGRIGTWRRDLSVRAGR
jgi:multiple sugar transport system permease protein